MGVVAHTLVIGSSPENPVTGRKADVIQAAYIASELALRMMKPGGENMIVTKTMQRVVSEYECVPIEGMYICYDETLFMFSFGLNLLGFSSI